jgi:hypothetical protein
VCPRASKTVVNWQQNRIPGSPQCPEATHRQGWPPAYTDLWPCVFGKGVTFSLCWGHHCPHAKQQFHEEWGPPPLPSSILCCVCVCDNVWVAMCVGVWVCLWVCVRSSVCMKLCECACMSVCVWKYVFLRVCVKVCLCENVYDSMWLWVRVGWCVYEWVCEYVCDYVCDSMCGCVSVCVIQLS